MLKIEIFEAREHRKKIVKSFFTSIWTLCFA